MEPLKTPHALPERQQCASEIVQLYQLCRLEIPSALIATTLFEELRNTFLCDAMTLVWRPAESSNARLFYESDTEVNCGFLDVGIFNQILIDSGTELFSCIESQHSMLKQISDLLPGVRHVMEKNFDTLVVYLTHAGNRSGAILLHRLCREQFSIAEKAVLIRWAPTLSLALSVEPDTCQLVTSEINAGILLLDNDMKIRFACCRGRKLIHLAQVASKGSGKDYDDDLESKLRAHFGFKDSVAASNFVVRNYWGSFQFRLYRLSDSKIDSDQLTAIAVHRQEPLSLCVFRGCKNLALTEKQTEISLLLMKGLSYDAVATRLTIRSTTVVDHVRKIYEKVGVSNRSELVTTLLFGGKKEPSGLSFQVTGAA